jgi:transcriptional regulator with XRE-family HTH domain
MGVEMGSSTDSVVSPIGTSVAESRRHRAEKSPDFRAELDRIAQFELIARLVINHRMERGWSQQELASRVGTSHSAISRLESGQHKTSVQTLQKIAQALGLRLVMGFESGEAAEATSEKARRSAAKIAVKKNKSGKFYFTVNAGNGKALASSEMYDSKSGATKGAVACQRAIAHAAIIDAEHEAGGKQSG